MGWKRAVGYGYNAKMNNKDGPPKHFEVDDPVAAFQKFEEATRRILSVPKAKVDALMAREKASRRRSKRSR